MNALVESSAPLCYFFPYPFPPPLKLKEGKCISIRGLGKEFKTMTGKKVAVSNLDLDIYSSQITAFLGHNGAGKVGQHFHIYLEVLSYMLMYILLGAPAPP